MKNPVNVIAAIGLALGGIFGMAGTMVSSSSLRSSFWAIDAIGLIVATALLAIRFFRNGDDFVASGFLVFAIGESVMLSGTAATLEAGVPSFAAGIALWSAALLLTSLPKTFAIWTRATGIIAAVLFAVTAAQIFWGTSLNGLSKPLPGFAYPFLILTFIGWIISLFKVPAAAPAQTIASTIGA